MNSETQVKALTADEIKNLNAPRKVYSPHFKVNRIRKRGRVERPAWDTRYSIAQLKRLVWNLNSEFIWGFDPVEGRADLVDRFVIDEVLRLYGNQRSVSVSFGFREFTIGSLKLIPTAMLMNGLPETYPQ